MKLRILSCLALLVAAEGCGAAQTSYVRSETTLGRVVVYRNGIAYFERIADVQGDTLKLAVPSDKVDDFLKSLTVVDAQTGKPAPIAYPTQQPGASAGTVDMNIRLNGAAPHKVKLSYVTESPSWKPSYRVVLGKDGKVEVQGWAIVDNTSGEDWDRVRLGVGSSSALSFRFDLQSIRVVERETLQANDLFAQAPPMGGAIYSNDGRPAPARVVADLGDEVLDFRDDRAGEAAFESDALTGAAAAPSVTAGSHGSGASHYKSAPRPTAQPPKKPSAPSSAQQVAGMARQLQSAGNAILVEGYALAGDADKQAASLERANKVREQLVKNGVDPSRVVAVGKGQQAGRAGGVRIVEAQLPAPKTEKGKDGPTKEPVAAGPAEPIGTSHFESESAMSVPRGTSAMVSILRAETDGEVVYLYDPESLRGNASFPFKAVRIMNPTDSALESGPVTVFGEGRFIGEGLCEPIPARSSAFVPFALDRQIVVERKDGEKDEIARVLTVQRGVFSTEVRHTRKATFTLFNRLAQPAVVYVRHTVAPGYELSRAPERQERVGNARLFRVEVPASGKLDVDVEETTPLLKTTDIRSGEGMELLRVYLSSAAAEGPLKGSIAKLLELHREMANIEQQIATVREQSQEYRTRMDELHAQIVTLKMVKSGGPLMQNLEKKLGDVSDRLSKATIDIAGFQEKLMIARVHFQDGVAELSLEKAPADKTEVAATDSKRR